MKRTIAGLSLALLVTVSLLAPGAAAAAGADKFAGKWVMNASKSQFSGPTALASSTVSISTAKHGGVKMTGDATFTNGQTAHYEYGGPTDGSGLPVTGNVPWDNVTLLHPDKSTLIRTERKGGKLVGITTATLSADGKSFTSVRRPLGSEPAMGYTAVWERAKH
jgi:hypothetical protein